MFANITPFGWFHTILSLVAIVAGGVALIAYRQFLSSTPSGRLYLITTAIVSATGFGLFPRGDGFNAAHVLSAVTLLALAIGWLAEGRRVFGRASHVVRLCAYSVTILAHLEALATEFCTRFPQGAPLATGHSDPVLFNTYVALTVTVSLFVLRQLRATSR